MNILFKCFASVCIKCLLLLFVSGYGAKIGPLVQKQYTLRNEPCKTECAPAPNRWFSIFKCKSYFSDELQDCRTTRYQYIQCYTSNGDPCVGMCTKHDSTFDSFLCQNINGKWQKCSPPSEEYILSEMAKMWQSLQQTESAKLCKNMNYKNLRFRDGLRKRRTLPTYQASGSILQYVAVLLALQANNPIPNLVVQVQNNNPICRYAYIQGTGRTSPILPLMISARITSSSLNPTGSRNSTAIPSAVLTNLDMMGRITNAPNGNNDESGHLIAYQNGGPNVVYNFAPQPQSLNRGVVRGVEVQQSSHWLQAENSINNWVRNGHGYVEQTVVVAYHDDPVQFPRPVGFGVHVVYYDRNGGVRFQCQDFYSNDPNDPPTATFID